MRDAREIGSEPRPGRDEGEVVGRGVTSDCWRLERVGVITGNDAMRKSGSGEWTWREGRGLGE